jgi:hypothetical protein
MVALNPGKIFWKLESGEVRQFPLKTLKVAAFLPREMSHHHANMASLPLSSFKTQWRSNLPIRSRKVLHEIGMI